MICIIDLTNARNGQESHYMNIEPTETGSHSTWHSPNAFIIDAISVELRTEPICGGFGSEQKIAPDCFPNRKAYRHPAVPSAVRFCWKCFLFARRDFEHPLACPRVVTVAVASPRQTPGVMDRNGSRSRRRSSVTVDDDTASRRNHFYRRESNMSE